MSKDTDIIFVYDSKKLIKEEDDPASAVLYFYPKWVPDEQKITLCGQLMGTIYCTEGAFSKVDVISLESGKFCIQHYGRYFLIVGTDRNVPDSILKYRRNILTSLVFLYHKDIASIFDLYCERDCLVKLCDIFESYLKIIGRTIFSTTLTLTLPKSATNAFVEAINFLQYCQNLDYGLGGFILFQNKVLASQVSPELTKLFVLTTDSKKITIPAEKVPLKIKLPPSVQLFFVYLKESEYQTLTVNSHENSSYFKELELSTSQDNVSQLGSPKSEDFMESFEKITPCSADWHSDVKPNDYKFLSLKTKVCDEQSSNSSQLSTFSSTNQSTESQTSKTKARVDSLIQFFNSKFKLANWGDSSLSKERRRTICDPVFPILKPNNMAVSFYANKYFNSSIKSQKYLKKNHRENVNFKDFKFRTISKTDLDKVTIKTTNNTSVESEKEVENELENAEVSKSSGYDSSSPLENTNQKTFFYDQENTTSDQTDAKKCVLFLYELKETTFGMIFEEEIVQSEENILSKLIGMCSSHLKKLENQLNQCLEKQPLKPINVNDPHNFVYLNKEWDTIKNHGAWGNLETTALENLNRDFDDNEELLEIIWRDKNDVIYGNKSDESTVFFHQSEKDNSTDAVIDLMGTIPLKARRILEDHFVVIL